MGLEIVFAFVFSLRFCAGYQAAPEQESKPFPQEEQVLVSSEIK